VAAVAQRIKSGHDRFSVGALPDTDIKRNTHRCFLRRIGPADVRCGLPAGRQFLCRETFYSRMSKDARQRSRKPETVRQHVFRASYPKFLAKPTVAVQDLPYDRLGVWRIDVALFH